MRHDNTGDGRGRHRRRNSPEAKAWLELERDPASVLNLPPEPKRNRHGIARLPGTAPPLEEIEPPQQPKRKPKKLAPAPECPPWLRPEEYEALVELRRGLA